MPFLVGLLFAPVGAVIGSLLFTTVVFLLFGRDPISTDQFIGMTFYGTIPGLVFATPITTLVLPTIYLVLRGRSVLSLKRLTVAAAPFGVAPILIASGWIWWHDDGKADRDFWLIMLGVAVDGAAVAALCANGFGRIMRALQPRAWKPACSKAGG